jgi:signal transduction histidine kinase
MDMLQGVPCTRLYSYEEIGDVSQGVRMGFDPLGRLALIQRGAFIVLNDATWLDIASRVDYPMDILALDLARDGHWYYGALGDWGIMTMNQRGRLHPESISGSDCPRWCATTNFSEITVTDDGEYFAGYGGVVYRNSRTGRQMFYEYSQANLLFHIRNQGYLTTLPDGIRRIDVDGEGRLVPVATGSRGDDISVHQIAQLNDRTVLYSTFDGRLFTFDGKAPTRWPANLGSGPENRVSALRVLPDGDVAVAVNGRGLFLVSPSGTIRQALTTSPFHRITALASHEPGVLWAATEIGVEKILYHQPMTLFGQGLGMTISWPLVARWRDRVVVCSGGLLYVSAREPSGATSRFEPMHNEPSPGVWAMAVAGDQLLVGNGRGVFKLEGENRFVPVGSPMDAARLALLAPDLCLVIGAAEMTALRWDGSQWRECASRVPGAGFPAVIHTFGNAVWIELGANRTARVTYDHGRIVTRVFDSFPWTARQWVNLSELDHTVVMTGAGERRVYFDPESGEQVDGGEVRRLLERAPFPITRIQRAEDGILWATHEHGVFTIRQTAEGDRYDTASFSLIDDPSPTVQLLPGGEVWISSGNSLYHVNRDFHAPAVPAAYPALVSVTDDRTGIQLPPDETGNGNLFTLPYSRNNISLRFFAGTYSYRRAPRYEFKLGNAGRGWTDAGLGSQLNFANLREGTYPLEVRLVDSQGTEGPPLTLTVAVLPPWHRTGLAYLIYGAATLLAAGLFLRWHSQHSRHRNELLQHRVDAQTHELKMAMQRLEDETRNSATLEERHRLAAEIHDSVQQGLSGIMLQVDATLKMSDLTAAVRSRLAIARKMISFTRHEVQHAVWDMESPMLKDALLQDAIANLISNVDSGTAQIGFAATGSDRPVSPAAKHHLLRIAQEAVTNAIRHANARHIDVKLEYGADGLALTVTDDGKGFDASAAPKERFGHFGLVGLRGRAKKIDARVEIVSAPGEGTAVVARLAYAGAIGETHTHVAAV